MTPRKEVLADGIELWLGDCREVLPLIGKVAGGFLTLDPYIRTSAARLDVRGHPLTDALGNRVASGDTTSVPRDLSSTKDGSLKVAMVTDPPYGILEITGDAVIGRANPKWGMWGNDREWDATISDALPFALKCADQAIVWGGHLYDLPPVRGWLIWDKIVRNFSSGHVELAWTTLEQPTRAFNYAHGELANEGKFHPTQKPLPLMQWCLGFLPPELTILDPFMGSGTTGVAAVKLGRKFIGVEIEERYFNIAVKRIQAALDAPDMFVEQPKPAVQEALL